MRTLLYIQDSKMPILDPKGYNIIVILYILAVYYIIPYIVQELGMRIIYYESHLTASKICISATPTNV